MTKAKREVSKTKAEDADAVPMIDDEIEAARAHEHAGGTIAGRAPAALVLRDGDTVEEDTGSRGADADREQVEQGKARGG